MEKLMQPQQTILTVPYAPDGVKTAENPPRFTWQPEDSKDLPYRLFISRDPEFPAEKTEEIGAIPYNFYTPDHTYEPGTYYWRYTLDLDEEYECSRTRSFEITEDAAVTPLPSRKDRFSRAVMSHPRIWLNEEQLKALQDRIREDRNACGYEEFYQKSVLEYKDKELIAEPLPYPGNKRVIPLWRQNYMDCQVALCHIRSLAVAGRLQMDGDLLNQAKAALLKIASWDTDGPTKRDYNDECAFRVAYSLAFGYDWLHELLDEEEKKLVFQSLFIRTKQVADHIILNTRIHYSMYDSHAVRSLSSVIVPCCIAMLGECQEAEQWLNYAIEYFNTIYTPWGGTDGGWAEGAAYWTTGMAFVTDAVNMIKSFTGIDIYKRPFFRKTGDFPLYCNPVDTYYTSFCDQSNLGDYPGHKVAFNIRQFAGVTGNADYQWYYEQVFKREPEINQEFYNKGWWDFYYDNMTYLHDYGDAVLKEPEECRRVAWFKDVGWVAINENLKDFDEHIFFMTKSSPYGSVSHSQADQNTFVLSAFGEPLVINSGYYIGFNSSMHRDWRRQTKSHNAILVRGQGQYAEMDKVKQLGAKGKVVTVEERKDCTYICEDATVAYEGMVPDLKSWVREIYEVDRRYFVIVDTVKTAETSDIQWKLHSLNPYEIKGQDFSVYGEKADLKGSVVYCSSGVESLTQTDQFEGVNPEELKGLKNQWHLTMQSGKAKEHVVVSVLLPVKKGQNEVVQVIKDDQGMDIFYYFNFEGNTFSVKVDGNARHNR